MYKKGNVLITGCIYGAGNIGDEAIFDGLLEILPKDIRIGTCIDSFPMRYLERGVRVFSTAPLGVFQAVLWADYIILGGASLLTDPFGPGYPIGFTCGVIRFARLLKKPCRFVGIGAGRLNDPMSRMLARECYIYADKFYTRNDLSSSAVVNELDVARDRVISMCDPAFLTGGRVDRRLGEKLLDGCGIKRNDGRPVLALSVVNEGFEVGRDYHQKIAEACDRLVREIGARIVFVYSEIRPGPFSDRAAAECVKGKMKEAWEEVPPKFFSPEEFSSLLGAFDAVITMRLHVLILASLSGTPVSVIVREEKVRQILEELGLCEAGTIDRLSAVDLCSSVKSNLASRVAIGEKLRKQINAVCARGLSVRDQIMEIDHHKVHSPRRARFKDLAVCTRMLARQLFRSAWVPLKSMRSTDA